MSAVREGCRRPSRGPFTGPRPMPSGGLKDQPGQHIHVAYLSRSFSDRGDTPEQALSGTVPVQHQRMKNRLEPPAPCADIVDFLGAKAGWTVASATSAACVMASAAFLDQAPRN